MKKKYKTVSWVVNCDFVTRKDETNTLLNFDKKDGRAVIRLDGYLICPKDMFTPRQLKMAKKKYGISSMIKIAYDKSKGVVYEPS